MPTPFPGAVGVCVSELSKSRLLRGKKPRLTTRFFAQISFLLSQDGRSDTTRTCDPFIPNEVRSQLRYTPTAFLLYMINTGVSTDSRRKILRKRKFILKKDLQNTRSCGNISKYDCQMGIYTLICVEAGGCGSAPDCSRFFRGVCPILNRAKKSEKRGNRRAAPGRPCVRFIRGSCEFRLCPRGLPRFLSVVRTAGFSIPAGETPGTVLENAKRPRTI